MSRQWNGKALVDYLGVRLWDSSDTFRGYILQWLNEIQSDIVGRIPLDNYLFTLKKLMPTEQEIVNLNIQVPVASTSAISAGGSLVNGSSYKVYVSFLVWDDDQKDYIESEALNASNEVIADSSNGTISLTGIDVLNGSSALSPTNIHRRVYLAAKASGATSYGEPLFIGDIEDNTTTTYSITVESVSTVTPPSDSEISQVSSKHLVFNSGNRWLSRVDYNRVKRFDPRNLTSTSPSSFDFVGSHKIMLYPKLSSGSTEDQRTLKYLVHRRPHEVFYEADREIDLPIEFRKALLEGVTWKAYEFRDRAGKESVQQNYELYKKEITNRYQRPKGRPSYIRDVSGDVRGFEV